MDKKMTFQIIVLVILIIGLIASAVWTFSKLRTPGRPQSASSGRATSMPEGQIPSTRNQQRQLAAQRMEQLAGSDVVINDNLFRVYQLSAPRNPFETDPDWYADTLAQVPGYPELLDEGYFESMEPYFPDITSLFGDQAEFEKIELKRVELPNQYSLTGSSADGRIKTTLNLVEPTAGSVDLTWTNDDMKVRSQGGTEAIKFDEQGNVLPLPGGSQGPSGVVGTGVGDAFNCLGISFQGDTPCALIYFNEQPYLVREGTQLAPNYRVEQIDQTGVLLIDRRDDTSKWVPLTGPTAGNGSKPTDSFLPVGLPAR